MLIILIRKILSLALIMAAGFALVRWGPLTRKDSQSLSRLSVWLVMPCSVVTSFQNADRSPEVLRGLLTALLAAVLIHVLLLVLSPVLKKLFHLDSVEQASVLYSNAGNLIIPLVASVLGPEWVIYTSPFILVQMLFLWSHARSIICEERDIELKKVLCNPNVLAVLAGALMFGMNLRLPALAADTVASVGKMVGPVSMLVTGMLVGTLKLRDVIGNRRVWMVAALRLVALPLICMGLLRLIGLMRPDSHGILLVTLLATTTPSASTITHLCQIYDRNSAYSSAICVVTTLLCAVTIPIMVWLYGV